MMKRRVSAYAGKYAIADTIEAPVKVLTPTMIRKVMHEFLTQVVEANRHPAIEVMFAEEELRSGKYTRGESKKGSAKVAQRA